MMTTKKKKKTLILQSKFIRCSLEKGNVEAETTLLNACSSIFIEMVRVPFHTKKKNNYTILKCGQTFKV